jgi:hypothetical protein
MAYHPLNLAFRFVLELAALAAMASYGWHLTEHTAPRLVAAIGLPLLAAAMWGVFAVPGDRSRSGKAPVAVPGWVRLTLELVFFGFAVWSLYTTGAGTLSLVLGVSVLVHYALSWERIRWLLETS